MMRAPVNAQNYYLDPRDNPVRFHLCRFLELCGEPDYYGRTHLYSNYYLDMLCRHKGRGKTEDDGRPTEKALAECEAMLALAQRNPEMLDLETWEGKVKELKGMIAS